MTPGEFKRKAGERLYKFVKYKWPNGTHVRLWELGVTSHSTRLILNMKVLTNSPTAIHRLVETCPELDWNWVYTGRGNMLIGEPNKRMVTYA